MYIVSLNKDKQFKPYLNVLIAPNLLMGPMAMYAGVLGTCLEIFYPAETVHYRLRGSMGLEKYKKVDKSRHLFFIQ